MKKVLKISHLRIRPELQNLLPMVAGDTYSELKSSIQQKGYLDSVSLIVVDKDHYIVDGYARFQILKELGYDSVTVIEKEFSSIEEEQLYRIRENINRRPFTEAEKTIYRKKIKESESVLAKPQEEIEETVEPVFSGILKESEIKKVPDNYFDCVVVNDLQYVNLAKKKVKDSGSLFFVAKDTEDLVSIIKKEQVKDIVVHERTKNSIRFLVCLKECDLTEKDKVRVLSGLFYEAIKYMIKSTKEGDSVLYLLADTFCPMIEAENRKLLTVAKNKEYETLAKSWDTLQKEYKKKMKKEEAVQPNGVNMQEMVHWLWVEKKGIPEEEFSKFGPAFFRKEMGALKDLLALHTKEQIEDAVEHFLSDKFWRPKVSYSLVLKRWADYVSSVAYKERGIIDFDETANDKREALEKLKEIQNKKLNGGLANE